MLLLDISRLKVERTEQNVLRRIDQQMVPKTSISEPPILLAVFWTEQVVQLFANNSQVIDD